MFTTGDFFDLLTLCVLEIVLGIDNLVLLAILVARLDPEKQPLARRVGLGLAMCTRIMLLTSIAFLTRLTKPLFTVPGTMFEVTGRDMVLGIGGLFLIAKATHEIHNRLEETDEDIAAPQSSNFWLIVVQIALIDIVFSLDSVITAVGVAKELWVMILAVIIAVMIMMAFAGPISKFINDHPSIKMLALSFLVLIGVVLVADAMHHHINRGYIYFAMGYSLMVEMLNLQSTRRKRAAKLKALGESAAS